MRRPLAIAIYLLIAAGIVWADLWSKEAVFRHLMCEIERDAVTGQPGMTLSHPKTLIPGWLDLECALNFGAFNGWFRNHTEWLAVISVIAGVIITGIVARPKQTSTWVVVPLGLLAGGALGNLYDRVQIGAVRDFIKVYRGDWVWPNFNLADSAICVGVGLLFLREFIVHRQAKRVEPAAAPIEEGEGAEGTPAS